MPTSQQAMQILTPPLEINNLMTTVNMLWGPAALGGTSRYQSTLATYPLDDSNDAGAGVICLPRDGTITHIGFYVGGILGSPPAYNVGLTTIDSSGNPTQTGYGGSTNTTYTADGAGWKWVALAGNATASAGDFAAIHAWPTGTAPDASNRMSIVSDTVGGANYGATYTTGWIMSPGFAPFAVMYDDNSIAGLALSTNTIGTAMRNNTTPDEAGCVFTVPAAMTVDGVRFISASWGSAAAFEVNIYSADNAVVATATVSDKDYVDTQTYVDLFFDSINLAAGTTYRVAVKPTVGTNGDIYLQRYQFESVAARQAWPFGDGSWQYTERTDGGDWSDVDTDLVYIGLWISAIEFTSQYGFSG